MQPSLFDHALTPATREADSPLAILTLSELAITLQSADILRSLGYPPETNPPSAIVQSVEGLMREADAYLQPRGTYSLYAPTAWTARSLEIGGSRIIGNVSEFLRGADRIAVFMVTVGSEITRQASMRCEAGDAFAGLVLDTIGSWAAELTAEALMTKLASHLGPEESFTLRYSPGYCGMDLSQQRLLFRLAPAATAGISLLPSLFMQPLKSISGLVGLGPRSVVGVHLSPCERCPQVGCHMRR